MKQQCYLANIYCSWLVYLGGFAVALYFNHWIFALAWLAGAPSFQALYISKFPKISRAMGYGVIADEAPAGAAGSAAGVKVTLFTALGCPFCPLIAQRLELLRKSLGFELEKIDITLRPELLASRGIRSVPAVEAGGRILTGLASSKELEEAIAGPFRGQAT